MLVGLFRPFQGDEAKVLGVGQPPGLPRLGRPGTDHPGGVPRAHLAAVLPQGGNLSLDGLADVKSAIDLRRTLAYTVDMPIVDLPALWLILLNFAAWGILQPAAASLGTLLPPKVFQPQRWLFRARRWEKDGAVYDRLLAVRRWKRLLPAGGTVRRGGFDMRRVTSHDPDYLRTWVVESCRAELVHWLALPPALLFFLWNPWPAGLIMIVYAIVVNGPCILAQRYNRPRFLALLERGSGHKAS